MIPPEETFVVSDKLIQIGLQKSILWFQSFHWKIFRHFIPAYINDNCVLCVNVCNCVILYSYSAISRHECFNMAGPHAVCVCVCVCVSVCVYNWGNFFITLINHSVNGMSKMSLFSVYLSSTPSSLSLCLSSLLLSPPVNMWTALTSVPQILNLKSVTLKQGYVYARGHLERFTFFK